MFHGTVNHMEETLILSSFKHVQTTIYVYQASASIIVPTFRKAKT